MFNVIDRITAISVICLIVASAIGITSCNSEAKRQQAAAEALVAKADSLLVKKNFDEAFLLMDSVDKAYPTSLDARRDVNRMRQQAMADYAQWQIFVCDSIIAECEAPVEAGKNQFKHIEGGDISGYYVLSNVPRSELMSTTTIEGRIDDETYRFYVVAINSGAPIGIHQIAIGTNDGTVSSESIPAESDRAGEIGKGAIDVATFQLGEVEDLMSWVADNVQQVDHALLMGNDGIRIPFTPAQAKAMVDTWQFADKASKLFQAQLQREKYERQLIIARDHSVNLD